MPKECGFPGIGVQQNFHSLKIIQSIIFSPSDDTMHGVKADYQHYLTQRTQICGNLWYSKSDVLYSPRWEQIVVNKSENFQNNKNQNKSYLINLYQKIKTSINKFRPKDPNVADRKKLSKISKNEILFKKKPKKVQKSYWGSNSPNVEDAIFRLQGKVLNNMYKLPSNKNITTSLDFGCGQGSTVNFFHQAGYDAYGIDICKGDIEIAKRRYPYIADKFKLCKPDVFKTPLKKFTDNKKISLITGHRSLMYFDKEDFEKLLKILIIL